MTTKTSNRRTTGWVGWIYFAALMLLFVGCINLIGGIAALAQDDVFVTTGAGLLLVSLTTWGWVHILIGAAQLVTGIFVLQGSPLAKTVAVFLVLLNGITQLSLLAASPFWALLVIAVDVLIIWAFVVHGDEVR